MTSLRGTSTGTASSSTSLTVPLVSGTAAGDLILIFGASVSSSFSTIPGFTASANTASGSVEGRAYMRVADGTEASVFPSGFPITLGSGSFVACAICAVYESPASIDPSAISAVYVDSSTTSSIAVPGITLAQSGDWLAWFGAGPTASTTAATITVPAGYTSRAAVSWFNNGTDGTGMTFADLETAQLAGATGTVTGSVSPGKHVAGWLVGVTPAAPGGVNSGLLDFFW